MPEKIVPMEIVRSGFAIDGRGLTRLYVEQTKSNTDLLIAKRKLRVAVRSGHPPDNPFVDAPENKRDQVSEGTLLDLFLTPDPDNEDEVILGMNAKLQGKLLKDYLDGTLPERSIGIVPSGMTTDGRLVGHYLDHVALLGLDPAAFPDLEPTFRSDEGKLTIFTKELAPVAPSGDRSTEPILEPKPQEMLSIFGKALDKIKSLFKSEDFQMPQEAVDKMKQAMEMMANAGALVGEALAALEGDKPEEEPLAGDDPGDEPGAGDLNADPPAGPAPTDQLKKSYLEVANGMDLPKDLHEKFANMAVAMGLDEAKAAYKNAAKVPPAGDLLNNPGGETSSATKRKEYIDQYMEQFSGSQEAAEESADRYFGKVEAA